MSTLPPAQAGVRLGHPGRCSGPKTDGWGRATCPRWMDKNDAVKRDTPCSPWPDFNNTPPGNEAQQKTAALRSRLNPAGVGSGLKGHDERRSAAPLTPLPTQKVKLCLDTADVVRDVKSRHRCPGRARENVQSPMSGFAVRTSASRLGGSCSSQNRTSICCLGPRGPSQKIELVFSASPETIRRSLGSACLLRSVGHSAGPGSLRIDDPVFV